MEDAAMVPVEKSETKKEKPEKMFTLKKWNAVAMWSWDVECDTCAICRIQVMGELSRIALSPSERPSDSQSRIPPATVEFGVSAFLTFDTLLKAFISSCCVWIRPCLVSSLMR